MTTKPWNEITIDDVRAYLREHVVALPNRTQWGVTTNTLIRKLSAMPNVKETRTKAQQHVRELCLQLVASGEVKDCGTRVSLGTGFAWISDALREHERAEESEGDAGVRSAEALRDALAAADLPFDYDGAVDVHLVNDENDHPEAVITARLTRSQAAAIVNALTLWTQMRR